MVRGVTCLGAELFRISWMAALALSVDWGPDLPLLGGLTFSGCADGHVGFSVSTLSTPPSDKYVALKFRLRVGGRTKWTVTKASTEARVRRNDRWQGATKSWTTSLRAGVPVFPPESGGLGLLFPIGAVVLGQGQSHRLSTSSSCLWWHLPVEPERPPKH